MAETTLKEYLNFKLNIFLTILAASYLKIPLEVCFFCVCRFRVVAMKIKKKPNLLLVSHSSSCLSVSKIVEKPSHLVACCCCWFLFILLLCFRFVFSNFIFIFIFGLNFFLPIFLASTVHYGFCCYCLCCFVAVFFVAFKFAGRSWTTKAAGSLSCGCWLRCVTLYSLHCAQAEVRRAASPPTVAGQLKFAFGAPTGQLSRQKRSYIRLHLCHLQSAFTRIIYLHMYMVYKLAYA